MIEYLLFVGGTVIWISTGYAAVLACGFVRNWWIKRKRERAKKWRGMTV